MALKLSAAVILLPLAVPVLGVHAPAQQLRPYRVIDTGVPIGQSPSAGVLARGLSPSGDQLAGVSVWEPFVWRRGVGMTALQKLGGYRSASANAVADHGRGIGHCGLDTGPWETYQAVAWDSTGAVTSLSQPGWSHSRGVDLNRFDQVLVNAGVPSGRWTVEKAFLGPLGGPLVELVPGAGASAAYDLNDRGQVVLTVDGTGYARYTPGTGLLPLPFRPLRLNEAGDVAGVDTQGRVMRYRDHGGLQGFTAPGTFRDVGGIDSFGQIVATEYVRTGISPPSYIHHGWLFGEAFGARKLDELVEHPGPVSIGIVAGISDGGVIAASGSINGDNRALLLEPRFLHVHGQGCAGSNNTPRMLAVGDPVAQGSVALLAAHGRPGGSGAFVLSPGSASIALPGGCTVLVDPAAAVLAAVALDPAGRARLALTVPAGAGGLSLFGQFVSVDPAAPNGVLALSNGVRIDVQ